MSTWKCFASLNALINIGMSTSICIYGSQEGPKNMEEGRKHVDAVMFSKNYAVLSLYAETMIEAVLLNVVRNYWKVRYFITLQIQYKNKIYVGWQGNLYWKLGIWFYMCKQVFTVIFAWFNWTAKSQQIWACSQEFTYNENVVDFWPTCTLGHLKIWDALEYIPEPMTSTLMYKL